MVALAFLRLIRIRILILIAVVQYLMRWCLLGPMFNINDFDFIITDGQFALLVLAGVLIAGGGYAINDYFDVKIDRINKPKKVVVDRFIPRRIAMATHIIFSAIGLALAFFVSYQLGIWKLSVLYFFASFALWFYSTSFRHQFLFGNLVIALLAGFVPMMVGIYEIPLQNREHSDLITEYGFSVFNQPAYWVIGYAIVFFILTLAREITKDIVDIKGDRLYGGNTIPIVLGITYTKAIIISVYVILGLAITWYYFNFLIHHTGMTPLFLLVCGLIVFQFILIFRSKTKKHFSRSANLNNIMTILVALSSILVMLSIQTNFE